jgi:hypothetical protein
VLQGIFIFYCVQYEPVKYGGTYEYPEWAETIGLCICLSSMIWIPGYAIYYLLWQPNSILEVRLFFIDIIHICIWMNHYELLVLRIYGKDLGQRWVNCTPTNRRLSPRKKPCAVKQFLCLRVRSCSSTIIPISLRRCKCCIILLFYNLREKRNVRL